MTNSPYSLIFTSLEIAASYIEMLKNEQNDKHDIFIALLLLERLIDKQRVLVEPGSGGLYPDEKSKIEQGLGELRVAIHTLGTQIGEEHTKIRYEKG